MDKKNVTKNDALKALAYLELVATDNSDNEEFVDAVNVVTARMLNMEALFASFADWIKQMN